jgi:hypothetical protein
MIRYRTDNILQEGVLLMKKDYSRKKISSYDKYQALRRKSSYRADYCEFYSWCRENNIDEAQYLDFPEAVKKAEPFCKKYGIIFLFNPVLSIPKHWGTDFFI